MRPPHNFTVFTLLVLQIFKNNGALVLLRGHFLILAHGPHFVLAGLVKLHISRPVNKTIGRSGGAGSGFFSSSFV